MTRRALVVGVDDYPSAPLAGCVNDAKAIAELLGRHADDSLNFDVQLITSETITISRASLKAEVDRLFNHDDADVALLYFAGHGTENNLDGYLVTPDAETYDEGVGLSDVLTLANSSKAREIVVMLDSCMSGALGEVPAIGDNRSVLREGVSILTASRSGQVSMESGGRGLFTELVCGALDGGAADVLGQVTAASVYAYVQEALGPWDQRPLFKSHVARFVPLRNAGPLVPLDVLRQLPAWFPTSDHVFPLDPSYEYTEEPHDECHEQTFRKLQQCRDAKLLEAVDEDFLYFAALNSTGCRLTALGRHYRRLADAGRI